MRKAYHSRNEAEAMAMTQAIALLPAGVAVDGFLIYELTQKQADGV